MGDKVKQHHGCGEDTHADNESHIAALYSMHDKKRSCHECRDQPYPMADTVRDFFPSRLLTLWYCKRYAHDIPSCGLLLRLTLCVWRGTLRKHARTMTVSLCVEPLVRLSSIPVFSEVSLESRE